MIYITSLPPLVGSFWHLAARSTVGNSSLPGCYEWLPVWLWAAVLWFVSLAVRSTPRPHGPEPKAWPRVSVIAPSRNEAVAVETATRSLLSSRYPNLEVIAVNDRSEDATGEILERLAAADPRLKVVHIHDLPAGWLGKNHACHRGAAQASGDWVLFTDGDVHHGPEVLSRAITHALAHDLGHLAGMPLIVARTFWERAFLSSSLMWILIRFRCWQLARPGSAGYAGVGAFNLIRRSDYERVGGYAAVAMDMADDMKLGMVLRRSGVRQALVDLTDCLEVEWMPGVWKAWRAHAERALCALEWQPRQAIFPLAIFAILASPLWRGLTLPSLLAFALATASHGLAARRLAGGSGAEGLTQLLMIPVLCAALVWGTVRAYLNDGTTWRGTHYSLADLRQGCVLERDWPASGSA